MREGQKRNFARHLRRQTTDAERLLWRRLRSRELLGYKFRRQYPVGRYVVDFACVGARIIIEVDGGQHVVPSLTRPERNTCEQPAISSCVSGTMTS